MFTKFTKFTVFPSLALFATGCAALGTETTALELEANEVAINVINMDETRSHEVAIGDLDCGILPPFSGDDSAKDRGDHALTVGAASVAVDGAPATLYLEDGSEAASFDFTRFANPSRTWLVRVYGERVDIYPSDDKKPGRSGDPDKN